MHTKKMFKIKQNYHQVVFRVHQDTYHQKTLSEITAFTGTTYRIGDTPPHLNNTTKNNGTQLTGGALTPVVMATV